MKKALSVILTLCMIFTIMPIAAFATDVTEIDLSGGDINITTDGTYSIVQTGAKPTGYTITVSATSAKITINDINIVAEGEKAAFTIAPNSSVDLTISGTNSLTSGDLYAGLWVPTGAAVTIQSTDGSAADSLTANGGAYGAGIGGSDAEGTSAEGATSGTINIKSGTIIAQGGNDLVNDSGGGAGIGGGWGGRTGGGSGGNITILAKDGDSAIVKATGSDFGAGIGSGWGYNVSGGNIIISSEAGGSVTVEAAGGACATGVGGGRGGHGGNISISAQTGGVTTVTAQGDRFAAGIGGGWDGDSGQIEITGSTVTAKGYEVGIGGKRTTGSVNISNSTIVAAGSYSALCAQEVNLGIAADYIWRTVETVSFTKSEDAAQTWEIGTPYLEVQIPLQSVALTPGIALNAGDTEKLAVTFNPEYASDRTVTWSSSDTSVATVDEKGKVTAISVGTAIITVTAINDISATCAVTVTVPATGITLDKTALDLNVGDSDALTATIAPEGAADEIIIWTSSNTDVATVDKSGNVVAVGAGTATITAATINGISATCDVTVTVPVTGITFDRSTFALNVGGSDTLTVTITPESATDKTITWTSSDESVATVDENGKVTAIGAGKAIITATAVGGFAATFEISVDETSSEPNEPAQSSCCILWFLRLVKQFLERLIYAFSLSGR